MSALHTALAEWLDARRFWDRPEDIEAALRKMIAAHPAPAESSECEDGVFGSQDIADALGGRGPDDATESSEGRLTEVVQALIACLPMHADGTGHVADCGYDEEATPCCGCFTLPSRLAAVLAARQPEGSEREEWGVLCAHDMSPGRNSEETARAEVANADCEPCNPRLVRRTVTSFPDVVGEWTEVEQ